jgi:hypothetical protein
MTKLAALVALALALAAPATAQASWGVVGDTGTIAAFGVVRMHYVPQGGYTGACVAGIPDWDCGMQYTTLAYTKNVADCPNGQVSPYDTGNVDGFTYLEDTGNGISTTGFDHVPALGDAVAQVALPNPVSPYDSWVFDPIYGDGEIICLAMLGPLPTVDINGVSILEGTTLLSNTSLAASATRKSVTFKIKDAGTHWLYNRVSIFHNGVLMKRSPINKGLGIKWTAGLAKGRSYTVQFRSWGYTASKTVTRKVTP